MLLSSLFLLSSVLTSCVSASPLSRIRDTNAVEERDDSQDPSQLQVPQSQWGFVNPADSRFDDPKNQGSWQVYATGQQINVSWIAPFTSAKIQLTSDDGKASQVIEENASGSTYLWTVTLPPNASPSSTTYFMNITAGSDAANDPTHEGLVFASSHFNVTSPPGPGIFGPIGGWSLGTVIAILFAFVVLVAVVAEQTASCVRKRRAGRVQYSSLPVPATSGRAVSFTAPYASGGASVPYAAGGLGASGAAGAAGAVGGARGLDADTRYEPLKHKATSSVDETNDNIALLDRH